MTSETQLVAVAEAKKRLFSNWITPLSILDSGIGYRIVVRHL